MATMVQAVRLALHYGEEHLGVTDVFGEDVGPPLGGVFTATQGLKTAWNSPLDERGIVGTAMGIAYGGGRPVCEIQFCDYGFNTIDLLKVAGNQRWAGAGEWDLPMVLMTPSGSGIRGSLYHSHSFESWASRLAGWKIVMPSNPLDAYGLMLSAIIDPNPVMVLLPKALLRVKGDKLIPGEPADHDQLKQMIDAPVGDRSRWQPKWPDVQEYTVPIGKASLVREGNDATVISYGRTLPLCVQAADQMRDEKGFTCDVLDLRSIFPYDWKAISASVAKTGRVLIVNEDTEVTNFAEHLLRRVIDAHFYDLLVKPRVLSGKHVPGIGLNQVYEQNTVPQLRQVKASLEKLASEQAQLMDTAQQQARIDAIRWYHEFDFGHGLKARSSTPDVAVHRSMWRFLESQLDAIEFRGKTVLDIGCWDGYWSFYAERRGARSVLAVDDASQNWSDGEGIHLARELLDSRIEVDQRVSTYELASLARTFDIVLFLGVYYHLVDPFHALAQIRHCCHDDSLLLVEGNEALGLPPKTAVFDHDMRTSKFLPSRDALAEWLRAAYFNVSAYSATETPLERLGWGWRVRMAIRALKGDRGAIVAHTQSLLAARRVFLTCVPTRGVNDAHYYKPPFGLHRFDGRFDD